MLKRIIQFFFCSVIIIADTSAGEFSLNSSPLLIKPYVANTFEPRVGLIWRNNGNALRLDIGNSIDLVQYVLDDQNSKITVGADFFTYTLLRGESNFHFPVDAVDYFFGGNINYKTRTDIGIVSSRIRLSHISAHFVDGHFDNFTNTWKNGQAARVYSREFLDLSLAISHMKYFREYFGMIYLWHVDPVSIDPFQYYFGSEFTYEFGAPIVPYAAVQFTFSAMRPRIELQTGGKLGSWEGRGTHVFFVYHTGNSIHGEYFDIQEAYTGFGFGIDF